MTYLRHFSVNACATSAVVIPVTIRGVSNGTVIFPSGGTTTWLTDRLLKFTTLILITSSWANTYGLSLRDNAIAWLGLAVSVARASCAPAASDAVAHAITRTPAESF